MDHGVKLGIAGAAELGIATLPPEELGQPLPEPHPSWMVRLEDDWIARFGISD